MKKFLIGYLLLSLIVVDSYILYNKEHGDGLTIKDLIVASIYSPVLFPMFLYTSVIRIGEIKL